MGKAAPKGAASRKATGQPKPAIPSIAGWGEAGGHCPGGRRRRRLSLAAAQPAIAAARRPSFYGIGRVPTWEAAAPAGWLRRSGGSSPPPAPPPPLPREGGAPFPVALPSLWGSVGLPRHIRTSPSRSGDARLGRQFPVDPSAGGVRLPLTFGHRSPAGETRVSGGRLPPILRLAVGSPSLTFGHRRHAAPSCVSDGSFPSILRMRLAALSRESCCFHR